VVDTPGAYRAGGFVCGFDKGIAANKPLVAVIDNTTWVFSGSGCFDNFCSAAYDSFNGRAN